MGLEHDLLDLWEWAYGRLWSVPWGEVLGVLGVLTYALVLCIIAYRIGRRES